MIHKSTVSVVSSDNGTSSGTTVGASTYQTGTIAASVDQVLPIGTDQAVPLAFTVANLTSLIILTAADATIKVNSSTAPDSTISMKAGVPLVWQAGGYFTSPFSASTSVSNLYVTVAAACRLQILVLS